MGQTIYLRAIFSDMLHKYTSIPAKKQVESCEGFYLSTR